jgi:hypothetical protein
MRDETSVDVLAEARSLDVLVAAPVVLVEPAPAAPVVPVVLLCCCDVVSLAIVPLVELGCVLVDVSVLDEVEPGVELGEVEELVAASEPLAEPDVLALPVCDDGVALVLCWS